MFEAVKAAIERIVDRVDELETDDHKAVPFDEVRALQEEAAAALGAVVQAETLAAACPQANPASAFKRAVDPAGAPAFFSNLLGQKVEAFRNEVGKETGTLVGMFLEPAPAGYRAELMFIIQWSDGAVNATPTRTVRVVLEPPAPTCDAQDDACTAADPLRCAVAWHRARALEGALADAFRENGGEGSDLVESFSEVLDVLSRLYESRGADGGGEVLDAIDTATAVLRGLGIELMKDEPAAEAVQPKA